MQDGEYDIDDDPKFKEALENSKGLIEMGRSLADAAIADAAASAGRTVEAQERRMGDRFDYAAAEQDPSQKQLDDYEISGEAVTIIR